MKLKQWLEAEPGRTVALAAHLQVSKSMVSQMANGKVRVPPAHYVGIRNFTKRQVDFVDLVPSPSDVRQPAHNEV